MSNVFYKDPQYGYVELIFKKANYPQGNLAVYMEFLQNGYCVNTNFITKNIPESINLDEDETFINTNNDLDILDIITKYEFGNVVKYIENNPIVKWDISKLYV